MKNQDQFKHQKLVVFVILLISLALLIFN